MSEKNNIGLAEWETFADMSRMWLRSAIKRAIRRGKIAKMEVLAELLEVNKDQLLDRLYGRVKIEWEFWEDCIEVLKDRDPDSVRRLCKRLFGDLNDG